MRASAMESVARGVVAHGAAFSKHFAAFTLVAEDGAFVADCVLAGKDGWDVDALRELCLALGLSGQTGNIDTGLERMTLASSSAGDASRETVEVDISRAKHETLPNASRVLHPAQLRARRKNADPSGEWRAWRAGTPSRDFATDADHDEAASSSVDVVSSAAERPASPDREGRRSASASAAAAAKRGRKKIKKDTRAAAFASLLVREFGVDALRGGAGVVDVAGGSGALSHELVTRWGVPCTIVDPRGDGVKVTARHRRLFASRDANAAAIAAEIGWSARSPLARHLLSEWTGFGKAAHLKRSFDASGMREAHFSSLLRDCSAIVGMHPDQATGALVDAALALRKPFAVVPCCVFPESHPERVSRATGERVRTTAELVDHLRARAGSNPDGSDVARVAVLPCDGANVAVFCADAKSAEGATPPKIGTLDWPWPSSPRDAPPPGPFRLRKT